MTETKDRWSSDYFYRMLRGLHNQPYYDVITEGYEDNPQPGMTCNEESDACLMAASPKMLYALHFARGGLSTEPKIFAEHIRIIDEALAKADKFNQKQYLFEKENEMVSEKRQQEWIKDLKELRSVKAENKRLKKAIHNVPTDEYGRVGREGTDDICGGWDWFLKKLTEWKEQALAS